MPARAGLLPLVPGMLLHSQEEGVEEALLINPQAEAMTEVTEQTETQRYQETSQSRPLLPVQTQEDREATTITSGLTDRGLIMQEARVEMGSLVSQQLHGTEPRLSRLRLTEQMVQVESLKHHPGMTTPMTKTA